MWNRFDICEVYYVFASEWHQGQSSPEYAIFGRLSRMQFRMRPYSGHAFPKHPSGEHDNARYLLACLIRRARKGWRPRRVA